MSKIEAICVLFGMLFVFIFLNDYFFIKRKYLKRLKNKKKRKKEDITEIVYLVGKFNLDKKKLPLKWLAIVFSIMNSFIISLVGVLVLILKINIVFKLILGFILLVALIYSLYELLGRYLVRKGYGLNGK